MDPSFLPAFRLAELTSGKKIGCVELLDHFLSRVERLNPRLNAVILRDADRARSRAQALDQGGRAKEGPLFGVPMTVKESFDLVSHPTTWGYEARRQHQAEQDALAVQRIEAAGAVVFGKTNVPVALADWQSFNPVYGSSSNPWNLDHTPGGSSGGAAAVVAAGLGGLEIGTDIGGSIRVPAHFCGIFGHKSTWGLSPMRGHSLVGATAMTDISVLGPLARSARDLGIALDALAGPDPIETALTFNLPEPRAHGIRDLRIAVWSAEPGQATSAETTAALEALADELARAGAEVSRTARPAIDPAEAFRLYITLLDAALSARAPEEELARKREGKRKLAADDMSADAMFLRATDLPHRDWLRANERRHQIRRAWAEFFHDWDVLLCPVFGRTALPHTQTDPIWERSYEVDGRMVPNSELLFWPGVTCGYHLPASVAPIAMSSDGLPIGVQIVGPPFGDRTTIHVAQMIEQAGHAFTPPPGWA